MYIESPEYRIPTKAGTLVLTELNARSNVKEDEITGLNWKDAWIELPDGKLTPIKDKSSIQDKVKNDVLNCLLARTYQRPMESRYEDVYMVDDYDPGYIRPRSEDENILDTDNDGDVDKTDVSNIVSAIIANDLGRTFEEDEE